MRASSRFAPLMVFFGLGPIIGLVVFLVPVLALEQRNAWGFAKTLGAIAGSPGVLLLIGFAYAFGGAQAFATGLAASLMRDRNGRSRFSPTLAVSVMSAFVSAYWVLGPRVAGPPLIVWTIIHLAPAFGCWLLVRRLRYPLNDAKQPG